MHLFAVDAYGGPDKSPSTVAEMISVSRQLVFKLQLSNQ